MSISCHYSQIKNRKPSNLLHILIKFVLNICSALKQQHKLDNLNFNMQNKKTTKKNTRTAKHCVI